METWEISGHTLEFYEDGHQYLVDGIMVDSITQMLQIKFKGKYKGIAKETLKRASELGTEAHRAIEEYCKTGIMADIPEVRNFRFLQRQYGFDVLQNEVPIILFVDGKPVSAGRLDLVIKMDDEIGGADIKRTAILDKEYLGYQLNLYRIAYRQCYGIEWKFLKGIHLRQSVRKFVDIPINERMALDLVHEYLEAKNE